jgi:RNA 2',3'-cyclic 3'-phosphodiesterase
MMKQLRLFFALWPSDDVRERVVATVGNLPRFAGRKVPAKNFHVTLAFLPSVPTQRLPMLMALAARQHGKSFELQFDRIEQWGRSHVIALLERWPLHL